MKRRIAAIVVIVPIVAAGLIASLTVLISNEEQVEEETSPETPEEVSETTLPGGVIVTGDIDKIAILSYEVTTEIKDWNQWEKYSDGFQVAYAYDSVPKGSQRYKITGTAQNITDSLLIPVKIRVIFYDAGNNRLSYGAYACFTEFDVDEEEIFDFEIVMAKKVGNDPEFCSVASFSFEVTDSWQ